MEARVAALSGFWDGHVTQKGKESQSWLDCQLTFVEMKYPIRAVDRRTRGAINCSYRIEGSAFYAESNNEKIHFHIAGLYDPVSGCSELFQTANQGKYKTTHQYWGTLDMANGSLLAACVTDGASLSLHYSTKNPIATSETANDRKEKQEYSLDSMNTVLWMGEIHWTDESVAKLEKCVILFARPEPEEKFGTLEGQGYVVAEEEHLEQAKVLISGRFEDTKSASTKATVRIQSDDPDSEIGTHTFQAIVDLANGQIQGDEPEVASLMLRITGVAQEPSPSTPRRSRLASFPSSEADPHDASMQSQSTPSSRRSSAVMESNPSSPVMASPGSSTGSTRPGTPATSAASSPVASSPTESPEGQGTSKSARRRQGRRRKSQAQPPPPPTAGPEDVEAYIQQQRELSAVRAASVAEVLMFTLPFEVVLPLNQRTPGRPMGPVRDYPYVHPVQLQHTHARRLQELAHMAKSGKGGGGRSEMKSPRQSPRGSPRTSPQSSPRSSAAGSPRAPGGPGSPRPRATPRQPPRQATGAPRSANAAPNRQARSPAGHQATGQGPPAHATARRHSVA